MYLALIQLLVKVLYRHNLRADSGRSLSPKVAVNTLKHTVSEGSRERVGGGGGGGRKITTVNHKY